METIKHLPDIPSGPQGGMVYNPDPYKVTLCPYKLRDMFHYASSIGKELSELTEEEREQFRIPGR